MRTRDTTEHDFQVAQVPAADRRLPGLAVVMIAALLAGLEILLNS